MMICTLVFLVLSDFLYSKVIGFLFLEMYGYNGTVATIFAPAETSTFTLNGCGLCMHVYSSSIHDIL